MSRNIDEQVIVITGASSGIGRTAARMFAERGGWTAMGTRAGANGSGGGNIMTQHPVAASIAGVAALVLAARFLFR